MSSRFHAVLDRTKPASVVAIGEGEPFQISAFVTPQQLIHLPPNYTQVGTEIRDPKEVKFISGPLTNFSDARAVLGKEKADAAKTRYRDRSLTPVVA